MPCVAGDAGGTPVAAASPHDLVLTLDNILCTVLEARQDALLVHPKYLRADDPRRKAGIDDATAGVRWRALGAWWVRVANPLDPSRSNRPTVSRHLVRASGERDYLLPIRSVARRWSPLQDVGQVLRAPARNRHHAITQRLLEVLRAALPGVPVGAAGSVLLGAEVPGVSDIDLVIGGGHHYRALRELILSDRVLGLKCLRADEWIDFYSKYRVICGFDAAEFARHEVSKALQFTYCGIPVSSFFIGSDQPKRREDGAHVGPPDYQMTGVVTDASRSMYLPGMLEVATGSRRDLVYIENRAYLAQASEGQTVEVIGWQADDGVVVVRSNRTDVIRSLPHQSAGAPRRAP
jgi:predicted nucleotidyltransferase